MMLSTVQFIKEHGFRIRCERAIFASDSETDIIGFTERIDWNRLRNFYDSEIINYAVFIHLYSLTEQEFFNLLYTITGQAQQSITYYGG